MEWLLRNWKRTALGTLAGGGVGFAASLLYIHFGST
jgi:preprotein translocase subunit Sss1